MEYISEELANELAPVYAKIGELLLSSLKEKSIVGQKAGYISLGQIFHRLSVDDTSELFAMGNALTQLNHVDFYGSVQEITNIYLDHVHIVSKELVDELRPHCYLQILKYSSVDTPEDQQGRVMLERTLAYYRTLVAHLNTME